MRGEAVTERGVIGTARQMMTGLRRGVRVGIGDDCAVLESDPGRLLLATTDLLIEDIHFRRRYAEPADLGWKSLAVNLSDIASMGGRPRWALVALAVPASTPAEEVEAFYEGLANLAAADDVTIVGGDTSASPAGWTINVTLLGEASRPLLRSTAREGDLIAVTGPLGRSAAGLAILERESAPPALPAELLADVTGAHLRPVPRVREGAWLGDAEAISAMIDVSDGLGTDLSHIAEESRVGAVVDLARVPVNEATRRVAAALGRDALAWATGGGEDYELLFTVAPDALPELAKGLARATGAEIHVIGEIVGAREGVRFHEGGREIAVGAGFQHFSAGAAVAPRDRTDT